MKKIFYIIDNLLIGGAQIHLLKLAKEINKEDDFFAHITCLGQIDQEIAKEFNLPIHIFKMDCIWRPFFWVNFFRLVKFIKKEKPYIVQTYLNTSNVFGVFAAKSSGVPVIISSRRDAGHFRSKIIGALERITATMSDKIICVSEAIKNSMLKTGFLAWGKITVIHNGTDEIFFKDRNGSKNVGYFNVSMVATMDRKIKGHSYFIEVAENIIKERKDVRFTLVGDGKLRSSLERYVNTKGLADYFNFTGKCKDLIEELNATDIFLVPSESEGCSNALLEAMAMGIPPIATAVEGNLEVIEDGISGYLVKPKDPSAIADKISELLNSPEKMEKIGIEARKRIVERFTLKAMARNYIELYEKLIEKKPVNKER